MSYDNDLPNDGDLAPSWPRSADDYTVVLVDDPAPHVRRITLNRPEKRNALDNALRSASCSTRCACRRPGPGRSG